MITAGLPALGFCTSCGAQDVRATVSVMGHMRGPALQVALNTTSGWQHCVQVVAIRVTNRRSSWACIGNPKLEQESIEGTHAQETPYEDCGHTRML